MSPRLPRRSPQYEWCACASCSGWFASCASQGIKHRSAIPDCPASCWLVGGYLARSSSTEVRIRVPRFSVVYFNRGTPQKREKGDYWGPSEITSEGPSWLLPYPVDKLSTTWAACKSRAQRLQNPAKRLKNFSACPAFRSPCERHLVCCHRPNSTLSFFDFIYTTCIYISLLLTWTSCHHIYI